jgi:hypothetical protein
MDPHHPSVTNFFAIKHDYMIADADIEPRVDFFDAVQNAYVYRLFFYVIVNY